MDYMNVLRGRLILNYFLDNNNIKIGIVGLGYVGLPLSVLFSKKYPVIGFDINKSKVEEYKSGVDITSELEDNSLIGRNILFTSSPKKLSGANFIIVTVPTPITEDKIPDLTYIKSATTMIAENIKENTIIVFESTVYPGVTEDVCIPLIEKITGFTCGNEFSVGYSPERISIGEKNKSVANIKKIVSGFDKKTLNIISKVYDSVLNNGVYEASSIKVAEAAKITENIQRDVNIALMNELSMVFDKMDIDTGEVIEAAETKWNFVRYTPGLVGGHCISVDPYYMIHKSEQLNVNPVLIKSSRCVNENIIDFISSKVLSTLSENGLNIKESNILVLGITFKENCNDIRNSKVINLIEQLNKHGVNTTVYDPFADSSQIYGRYGIKLTENYNGKYDAVILAVSHDIFRELSYEKICEISRNKPILFDLKSIFKHFPQDEIVYWSL